MASGYQFYTVRTATFNVQSRIRKNVQHNNISLIKWIKYELSFATNYTFTLCLFFLNFSHLSFIRGNSLVPVADVNNGWSSCCFNNVSKFEIPHFFTLVFSRKCDSCWSKFFRYVYYHLSGLNNSFSFRVNCIAGSCHVNFVWHYGAFSVFWKQPR